MVSVVVVVVDIRGMGLCERGGKEEEEGEGAGGAGRWLDGATTLT
jgi:hypothetical protein